SAEHLDDDEFGVEVPVIRHQPREVSSALIAAESDTPDETFGDSDVELTNSSSREPSISAPLLVADPAESGVFARVLLDDDDDALPLEQDDGDDDPTVGVDAVTHEVDAATRQVDAVRDEPKPVEPPVVEPPPVVEVASAEPVLETGDESEID